jgi:hypothetical protein
MEFLPLGAVGPLVPQFGEVTLVCDLEIFEEHG